VLSNPAESLTFNREFKKQLGQEWKELTVEERMRYQSVADERNSQLRSIACKTRPTQKHTQTQTQTPPASCTLTGNDSEVLTEAEFGLVVKSMSMPRLVQEWEAVFSRPTGFQGAPYIIKAGGGLADLAPDSDIAAAQTLAAAAADPTRVSHIPVGDAEAGDSPPPATAAATSAASTQQPLHGHNPHVCYSKGDCRRYSKLVRDIANAICTHMNSFIANTDSDHISHFYELMFDHAGGGCRSFFSWWGIFCGNH
jgi:hypothetical protein